MTNTLAEYLQANGMPQTAFAGRIGVSQQMVSSLARGDRKPSFRLAARIEKATEGAVPISGWYSDDHLGAAA